MLAELELEPDAELEQLLLLPLTLATDVGCTELAGITLLALLTAGCTAAAGTLTPPALAAAAAAAAAAGAPLGTTGLGWFCAGLVGKGVARPDCDSRNG